ncbi:glycosyltransferase family 4 protein [Candidatus Falkowbacteria bacterium]|nr:glycosyltransferase family 4 protein [Candidatus Falkowbacteria bacterium]
MKILIVNNLYKPFARGGAEKLAEMMVQELTAMGHEVMILTSLPRGERTQATAEQIAYLPGASRLFFGLNKLPAPLRLLFHLYGLIDPVAYFYTKRLIKKEKIELVVTHNLIGLGLVAFLAVKRSKIRHVHILHDIQLLHPSGLMLWQNEGLIKSISARAYQHLTACYSGAAMKVVSPSSWLLQLHKQAGLFKNAAAEVQPNPFAEKMMCDTGTARKVAQCLFVGQLEKHKGID